MDFEDSPEEAQFRARARDWLEREGPRKGEFSRLTNDLDRLAAARDWQRRKYEAGYSCMTWPREWGGVGGTAIQQVIYNQEEAGFDPPHGFFEVTLGMCIPTILKVGDEAAKRRFVQPALLGEAVWCQLFSEPAAGSDLAGLRTRAVRDTDEWVVTGQKLWTSCAQVADYGLLLARTDPDKPKHKGLTMFWIDMRAPGIDIRPIRQMSGRANFNEVWFDGLRVPDSQRLGAVDDGWRVSLVTLMNERLSIGGAHGVDYDALLSLASSVRMPDGKPAIDDPGFRDSLADWYIASEGVRLTGFRTLTALSRGQTPGPEASIGKVVIANLSQRVAQAALDIQGEAGLIADPSLAPVEALFQKSLIGAPGMRLAGGTDEILRNVIAERVLGLPGEIRTDKDVPFRSIPTR